MAMNFHHRRNEEPEINLIPFIDVLLVILIFLMVTTTYSKFTELQITLPYVGRITVHAEPVSRQPFGIGVRFVEVDDDTTAKLAREYAARAIDCLKALPDNDYRAALIELSEFAVARTH